MAQEKNLVLVVRQDVIDECASLRDVATLKEYKTVDGDLGIISDEDCEVMKALITGHLTRVDRAFLSRCKKLRIVMRCGIGYERVDTAASGEAGVLVCNIPDYCIEEVADTAMAHILALFRQTSFLDRALRDGQYVAEDAEIAACAKGCRRVRGSTLGLVGLGKIGIAVAQRAKSFGLHIAYYDPFTPSGLGMAVGGVEEVSSVEELVRRSDCVSLHCNLTAHNHHIINEAVLKKFKKTAFLVNTSRGGLIDEAALSRALKEGWLAGAALDAVESEPLVLQESVLTGAPNLITTPHTAWYSPQSRQDCFNVCIQCVRAALQSSDTADIPHCVNRHQLNTTACKARWT